MSKSQDDKEDKETEMSQGAAVIVQTHDAGEAEREKRNSELKPITGLPKDTSNEKSVAGAETASGLDQDKPPIDGSGSKQPVGSMTEHVNPAAELVHEPVSATNTQLSAKATTNPGMKSEPSLENSTLVPSHTAPTPGTAAPITSKVEQSNQARPVSPPDVNERGSSLTFGKSSGESRRTGPAGADKSEKSGYGHERRGSLSEVFTGTAVDGKQHFDSHDTTVGKATAVEQVFASSDPTKTTEMPIRERSATAIPAGSPVVPAPPSAGLDAQEKNLETNTEKPAEKARVSPSAESENEKAHGVRGWLKSKVGKIGNKSSKTSGSEQDPTSPQSPPAFVVDGAGSSANEPSTSERTTSLRDMAMIGRQQSKPSSVVAMLDGHAGDVAPPHSTSTDINGRDIAQGNAKRNPSVSPEVASRLTGHAQGTDAAHDRGRSISPVSLERVPTGPGETFVDAPESQTEPSVELAKTLSPKLSSLSSGQAGGIKLDRKAAGVSPVRDSKFREEL